MTNKITNVEELMSALETMRAAHREFATFTQEQVDELFYKAAMAINNLRIPLAQMAVEETGMGLVEDKVIKNHYASEYIYNKYRNEKIKKQILSIVAALLSSDFEFIDYQNSDIDGKNIVVTSDIASEEVLMYVSMI